MPKKSPSARSGGQGKRTKKRASALPRPIGIPDRTPAVEKTTAESPTLDESEATSESEIPASTTSTTSTVTTTSPARAAAAQRAARQRGGTSSLVDPQHYRYVYKDLRLIAILAAAMFLVIIVLSFFLH